ncbi:MAG: 5-bromo-4-chloroindolyl phosphate hydrolysis family protein [Fibrobacteres bacterium]|nr:5-bromo-4-chloroindolyl phosphate hydrolysis family protein [Fibrobacterota bacterium]
MILSTDPTLGRGVGLPDAMARSHPGFLHGRQASTRGGLERMRHVWAGVVGGAGFCALFLWANMALLPSLGGCAVAACSVYLLAMGANRNSLSMEPDRFMADLALENGARQSSEIKRLATLIADPKLRREAETIGVVASGILSDLRAHPKDSSRARRFLDYYLESTRKILAKYVELSGRNLSTPEAKASLAGIGNLLSEVRQGFERQRADLAESDLIDLDVEMKLLRTTMKMDGN